MKTVHPGEPIGIEILFCNAQSGTGGTRVIYGMVSLGGKLRIYPQSDAASGFFGCTAKAF
jgi:hypothetical protein